MAPKLAHRQKRFPAESLPAGMGAGVTTNIDLGGRPVCDSYHKQSDVFDEEVGSDGVIFRMLREVSVPNKAGSDSCR